jgi:nicotinamidase/pyrazinamidase
MSMKALFLVDIQNDFCPAGALAVARGDEVVPVANELIGWFSSRGLPVLASRDWHPEGHCSFASRYPGHVIGDIIDIDGITQVLWPDHCVQGGSGAEFHPVLDAAHIGRVFDKGCDAGVDSYSAFFDNAHLHDTGLDAYLRAQDVDELYVCGLATDYCVKHTVLDALALGYRVTLMVDGCRAVDASPGDGARAIAEMEAAGCVVRQGSTI